MTNHHIVLDGWSMPILLGEVFASYYGQRLPVTAPYRSFVSWLAARDHDAARAAWGDDFPGFAAHLAGTPDPLDGVELDYAGLVELLRSRPSLTSVSVPTG